MVHNERLRREKLIIDRCNSCLYDRKFIKLLISKSIQNLCRTYKKTLMGIPDIGCQDSLRDRDAAVLILVIISQEFLDRNRL